MKNKGQMLIEIVISVGVLALVLIGVSDLMTRTQRVSSFQAKREEALSIAKEVLNDYRVQRDNDLDDFEENVVGFTREVCVDGKDYSCRTEITKNGGSVDIIVVVSWVDGENTLSVDISQKLEEL